jgi:hypothetical protein
MSGGGIAPRDTPGTVVKEDLRSPPWWAGIGLAILVSIAAG